jgi:broad specificity phosphatase PhoE
MVKRVLLIRHGETDDNIIERDVQPMTRADFARYIASGDDAMLTESGREQARSLGLRLSASGLERLYVSPLKRARDTAALLSSTMVLPPPIIVEELRELIPIGNAVASNDPNQMIALRRQLWPAYARMLVLPSSNDRLDRSWRRMRRAWRIITADERLKTIGVVGHGWATIILIRMLQLDWRWRVGRVDLAPCGVTVVERR